MGWVDKNTLEAGHPLWPHLAGLELQPEFGTLLAQDGATQLHYQLLKPTDFDPTKRYPVLIYVYGGPHVQLVNKAGSGWGDRHFFFQFLLQQGVLVFSLDNRGSSNRGKQFEQAIYRKLCVAEVQDQVTGADFLRGERASARAAEAGQGCRTSTRIRSGSMGTAMAGTWRSCACARLRYFKVAVSGAPVSDWRLYDTHYTERYQVLGRRSCMTVVRAPRRTTRTVMRAARCCRICISTTINTAGCSSITGWRTTMCCL